jgi:AmmeMemoRadiSam system protein B
VAGTFYPRDADVLARDVDAMMRTARSSSPTPSVAPKALIVPHAGYVYSGAIAATAYATIPSGSEIERVVLIGPAHRVFVEGVAAPSARWLRTPLGDVDVDGDALDRARVARNDAAHAQEHSLEVELPFLQRVVPGARVCPIVCGRVDAPAVAACLDALWGASETLIVVSSDLSHYLPYDEGRAADERTAKKIVALEGDLGGDDACGYAGIRGLLAVARAKGLACALLDLRSSGDTAGPRNAVVGYGAFAFREESS